jgi:hypothetical protein
MINVLLIGEGCVTSNSIVSYETAFVDILELQFHAFKSGSKNVLRLKLWCFSLSWHSQDLQRKSNLVMVNQTSDPFHSLEMGKSVVDRPTMGKISGSSMQPSSLGTDR